MSRRLFSCWSRSQFLTPLRAVFQRGSLLMGLALLGAVPKTGAPGTLRGTPRNPDVGSSGDSATVVTAFVNVNVIPMDRERVLRAQTVLVQGGRIIALGPVAHVRVPRGATQVDGRGKFLIPGLADMHFHLGLNDSVYTERYLSLLVINGVTTIRNVDYASKDGGSFWMPATELEGPDLLRLRARAAAGQLFSPRIYTSGGWSDYGNTTPAGIAKTIAAYQAAGYDFIKIHDEDRVTFDSVAAAARRLKIPFVGHVPSGVSFDEAMAAGYRSIEHLYAYVPALVKGDLSPEAKTQLVDSDSESDSAFLAMVRQRLDPSRIPALAAATRRAGVWNCPTEYLSEVGAPSFHFDTIPELRYVPGYDTSRPKGYHGHNSEIRLVAGDGGTIDLRRRIIRALQTAGAGLLLGTDGPLVVPGFSVHRELAAFVASGLTPYQALATGTRNVAEYFGTLNETGTIATGKRADLVLLDANPLVDIHNTTRIQGVMLAGRWFPRTELDRRLATFVRH